MTEDQLKNVITPGGSIDSLASGLNQLDPQGRFSALQGSGGSQQAMFNAIRGSIDNGTGSILNVAPGSSLAGHTFAPGHFIAATGYNPDGTINLSDTAGGRQYAVSQADAFQATQGRGIVAGTGTGPSASAGMPAGYTDPSTWGVNRGGGLSAGPGGKGGSGGALGTPGATGSPVDGSLDPVMTPDGLPKQMTGQGQGFGLSGGGILGAATSGAIGAGSMALNGLAPGAGQAAGIAAQIGMQELSEGITYAGQVAGIAASGLLQTFMPNAPTTGWGAKLLGSVMGAHPVTTNSADQSQQGKKGSQQGDDGRPDPGKDAQGGDTTGTSAPPLKPDDKSQQPGGQGAPGDTVHGSQFNGPVTVNNGPTQDQVAQAGMQATQSSFGLTP